VRSFPVRITGSIPRTVATVTLTPPQLTVSPGQTLDLRGRNSWLDGIPPLKYQGEGDTIISAVRRDDSFVDLTGSPVRFSSNRPSVVKVDPRTGILTALAPGVATVTVTIAGRSASAPFVVS
jgi:uncharacterized protein YjdB